MAVEAAPGLLHRLAPAKVNLTLHLRGRRADGYHLLDSLVVFPRIGDRLTVRPAPGLSLEVSGPFAQGLPGEGLPGQELPGRGEGAEAGNLVFRAARDLAAHHSRAPS
ncbi:MAG TPA: hypothetical protein VK090_03770, partial [Paracoccaceae bacterium]|nr:hypothetical protein [Paracoccaceae bacterium]